MRSRRTAIVWFAGVDWDSVPGTDRRIVSGMARTLPIIWVEPPRKTAWRVWGRAIETEVVGVSRVSVPATPAATRWPIRTLTRFLGWATFRRLSKTIDVSGVVVANPTIRFPRAAARKVLYVTDDWEAGAELMGLDRSWVVRTVQWNAARADVVAAVSPELASVFSETAAPFVVLPNGAPDPLSALGRTGPRSAVAGLVGQVNERLDLSVLEELAEADVPVRVIGPLTARDPAFRERFQRIVALPSVDWRGLVPPGHLAGHLEDIAVGLTPYTRSRFNRASSPLKTLEYLAAGVPVVSTDLPASRWLDTPDVRVCEDAAQVVAAVRQAISVGADPEGELRRRAFAAGHSWGRRASVMLALVADGPPSLGERQAAH